MICIKKYNTLNRIYHSYKNKISKTLFYYKISYRIDILLEQYK